MTGEEMMSDGETRSLNQIRREADDARADLTTTVDQLRSTVKDTATEIRDRLRPDAIKAEVSEYIKSRGEQFVSDVKDAAQRNPMQAVAVGASLAYPLFRVARAIPVPILMIGAGIFFAGSKQGRDLTQQASNVTNDLLEKAREQAQDLGEQVSQTVGDAQDHATDAVKQATDVAADGLGRVKKRLSDMTDNLSAGARSNLRIVRDNATLTAGVSDLKEKAVGIATAASSSVTDRVSSAASTVRETAAQTTRAGQEMLSNARDHVSDVGQRTSQTITETIAENPLLVAGVGLLIGGLIANALPKSPAEDALLGDASQSLKKRAQDTAAHGFKSAKGAAGKIVENVAQKLKAEGLTPDDLANGTDDVKRRLQRLAERAINTAFDAAPRDNGSEKGEQHG
jgi:ElaB/YqjD/DUF883 family membrane-anchored ribosome-binding protein